MNLGSVDIANMLVKANLGALGKDIFIGKQPDNPDNCVVLYDTGGGEQNPKFAIDEFTLQIRSRDINYKKGFEALNKIKLYLEGKSDITVNNSTYVGFWMTSNIAFMSYDSHNRAMWTSNYRVIRQSDKSGNRV